MNKKRNRFIIIAFSLTLHLVLIFFVVFDTRGIFQENTEIARILRLVDFEELPPPPPPPPPEPEPVVFQEIPRVERIAETFTITEVIPEQEEIITETNPSYTFEDGEFLGAHLVSVIPQFDSGSIARDIIYPPLALRSGIEGRVILDLFVDQAGTVQRVSVIREEPEGRGFGEAAVRVFTGRIGTPATINGEPVPCRFRYPVSFRIR
jgi:protein TonB